jgi:hypothetical protein
LEKQQQAAIMRRLAREGALVEVQRLITLFPDLIEDVPRPKRRLTPAMRAELSAHLDGAESNGAAPKEPKKKKWSAARRRKFMATWRRKAREAATK